MANTKEYYRQYYLANKERLLVKQNNYYQAHKDERIAYQMTPERQAYTKKWQKDNPDKVCSYAKRYQKKNPEPHKRANIKYRQTFKGKLRRADTQARRRKQIGSEKVDILQLVASYSGNCGICNLPLNIQTEPFHIDHIRPLAAGGLHKLDNLQIAHPLCNQKKGKRIQI